MLRLAYSIDNCFGSRPGADCPDRVVSLLFLVCGVLQMTVSCALFIAVYLCFSHQEALYTFPNEAPAIAAALGVISLATGGVNAWKGWHRSHGTSYATVFLSLMKFLFSVMIIVYSVATARHARGELTRVVASVFIVCCCLLALPEPYLSWLLFRCSRSFSLSKLFFRLSDDGRCIVNDGSSDGLPGHTAESCDRHGHVDMQKGACMPTGYPLSLLYSQERIRVPSPAMEPLPFLAPCSPGSSLRMRLDEGQSTAVQTSPLHETVDPRQLHLLTKPIHENLSSHMMQSSSGHRNEGFSEDVV